jgi:signal transduction histidine kinase
VRGGSSVSQRSQPRFLWQGALIILPALLLAGLGLYSLRQDRVLARVEATEQAGRLVQELTQLVLPRTLESGLSQFEKLDAMDPRWMSAPTSSEEALMRLRKEGRWTADAPGWFGAACMLDEEGRLVYPPPLGGLAVPQPLELDALTPAQLSAWFACEEMWLAGAPDVRRVSALVALQVPERLIAVARLRTALSLMRGRETIGSGISELRGLQETPRELQSETGIPVRDLARLQLASLTGILPEAERRMVVDGLCAELLRSPSPVGEAMWESLRRRNPNAWLAEWAEARELHALGRELAIVIASGELVPGALTFRGEECWAVERRVNGGRWVVAVPTAKLREAVWEIQSAVMKPAHFGVEVRLNEQALAPRAPDQPVLAEGKADVSGVPLEVTVFLSDPAGFDVQREVRARQLMALIGAAMFAVLVGFFAAWRAFRRQRQLSEMKTNFVSSVSHELRAPIASVQLMAEELVDGERPSDEKLAKYHRFIGQECRRLSGVIENVLDFARREQGRERFEFEPTDLDALVSGTVQLLRPYAAEKGVKIEEERRGDVQVVEADGHALQRVLVNLLDNAIKHSPEGSAVVVGLEFEVQRVLLWVEDDGQGIPRAEQERIFEKFYRIGSELRRQTQGVGLGLSIVKHLAEVHGGRVLVHSNVGEGSRFTVELPLRARPSISTQTFNESQIAP